MTLSVDIRGNDCGTKFDHIVPLAPVCSLGLKKVPPLQLDIEHTPTPVCALKITTACPKNNKDKMSIEVKQLTTKKKQNRQAVHFSSVIYLRETINMKYRQISHAIIIQGP